MIRKQVYIEPKHERMLKRLSESRGVPESVLIREGIERVTAGPAHAMDPASWEREERFIRERRTMDVPQTGRGWQRDELYEERLGRSRPRPR